MGKPPAVDNGGVVRIVDGVEVCLDELALDTASETGVVDILAVMEL